MRLKTTRIQALLAALQIPGSPFTKIANFLVALRWQKNTAKYIQCLGKPPNYVFPRSLSEKMQWRKVFDRNPLFKVFSDKLEARWYIEKTVPGMGIPQLYWSGDKPDDIPFADLINPYVVKATIGSGDVLLVRDPNIVNKSEVLARCKEWLGRKSYGKSSGEWGYQNIKNRIIVEEFLMGDDPSEPVVNYKFFVFCGRVVFVQLESARSGVSHLTFFDRDGVRMSVRKWVGRLAPDKMSLPDKSLSLPGDFSSMVHMAEKIGANIDHVRVDMYWINGQMYFSELTSYDGSGYSYLYAWDAEFVDRPSNELDFEIGKHWDLPEVSVTQKLSALCGLR
jgi:hypothetical protein